MNIERFRPPPTTPNCVSTEAPKGSAHWIEPMPFTKSWQEAKEILKREVGQLPRTVIAIDDGPYLRYEARSAVFKFIDDVEFRFDEESSVLHFRSASRTGKYDFEVNRKRMENLRAQLHGKI